MNALRKVDINIEIENYMNKYRKFINYADQDILNGIFKGKIGELDPKYDVMTIDVVYSYEEIQQLRRPTNFCTKEELYIAKNNPTIIHLSLIHIFLPTRLWKSWKDIRCFRPASIW